MRAPIMLALCLTCALVAMAQPDPNAPPPQEPPDQQSEMSQIVLGIADQMPPVCKSTPILCC